MQYGGWVAENIYYLGHAGVVEFGGLRIAGISGIYKPYDYKLGTCIYYYYYYYYYYYIAIIYFGLSTNGGKMANK